MSNEQSPINELPPEAFRSPELLRREDAVLVIVDVQEKLISLIQNNKRLVWNIRRLLDGTKVMQVPVLATEQYPKGLSSTITELATKILEVQTHIPAKLAFSCCGSTEFNNQLAKLNRQQVILVGIESHVCVLQTASDLLAQGFDVHLVVDAIGARSSFDHDIAMRRLESNGATLTTTETVLFELCQQAGTPEFKVISQLVREACPEN